MTINPILNDQRLKVVAEGISEAVATAGESTREFWWKTFRALADLDGAVTAAKVVSIAARLLRGNPSVNSLWTPSAQEISVWIDAYTVREALGD